MFSVNMSLSSVMASVVTTMGLSVALAMLLDYLLGESRRGHPLVDFGRLASGLERRLWRADVHPWLCTFARCVGRCTVIDSGSVQVCFINP